MSDDTDNRFVDSQGNTYTLNPDSPTLKRIRDQIGVNLTTPAGYAKMRFDPLLVADVMEFLCAAQRESFKRSQEDFSRDVLKSKGAALIAITEAMELFLEEDALADLLEKKQMSSTDLRMASMLDSVMEKVEQGDPEAIKTAVEMAGAMGLTE